VNAGLAGAHIEDQVMPKRCGHIAGKALVPASEYVAKLRMMRAVADDLGHRDFVIIARTDGVSATDAPEPQRGLPLAIDRALRYLDSGVPDLVWCEFPTAERRPTELFHEEVLKRFPEARFAFNYSSSFKWHNEDDPLTWAELSQMGVRFIFITLAAQHAMGMATSHLFEDLKAGKQDAYIALQRREWAGEDQVPTRSHHLFTGVPYHHLMGEQLGTARFGHSVDQHLEMAQVV
jgi:isocitrate lyase